MLCYLNGNYLALNEAKVSVLDRGFLFGDGVYEVIPAFHQKLLAADAHLERLNKSLAGIGMHQPAIEWQPIFEKLLRESGLSHASIYVQITRGAYETRNHLAPDEINPTIFIAVFPVAHPNPIHQGIRTCTTTDHRWANCYIKAITLLPNVLAKHHAKTQDLYDAIFVKDGYAVEGTSSNLFIVKDGHVYTAPLTANILHGITRNLVLSLLKNKAIPHAEQMIPLETLYTADEIWFTNSTGGIIPIIEVDGRMISQGKPGPLWQQLHHDYEAIL